MRKLTRFPWRAAALALCGLTATVKPTHAQPEGEPTVVYPLYPNGAPGLQGDGPPETSEDGRVRNVTVPTLTVFRPKPSAAADVAIIIAPGGGFEHLSIANEGIAVARALAARGVTAIVLKYRLAASAPRTGAPPPAPSSVAAGPSPPVSRSATATDRMDAVNRSPAALRAMADGDAAVAFVRAHARDLHISPDRIGFLGFSAGAVVAVHVAASPDPATRPDFAAAIYGAMPKGAVATAQAPPLFLAVAADDKLVGPAGSLPIFDAWRAAGRDVELHVFQSGGHGFGMKHQGGTSDHWIDDYLWWLEARGLLPGR